jgi:hypothetical protein
MLLNYFILFLHKKEWLELLSKMRCSKIEKNKHQFAFHNISRPFKQTRVISSRVSHYNVRQFHSIEMKNCMKSFLTLYEPQFNFCRIAAK